jgi:hypothetical protein
VAKHHGTHAKADERKRRLPGHVRFDEGIDFL